MKKTVSMADELSLGTRVTPNLQKCLNRREDLMFFMVEIDISIPNTIGNDELKQLQTAEAALAKSYQTSGQWIGIYRVVARYANVSLFDVDSTDELHAILTSLPLFPYMSVKVTPLCKHPASIS